MAARRNSRAGRRTVPQRPDLPTELTAAPGALEARDSWDGVGADAELQVPTEAHDLADLELLQCTFTGVDLSSRTFSGLRARDVLFTGCDLSGAVLDSATLDRVVFSGCRLTGTALSGTRLTDVLIEDSVARVANFRAATAVRLHVVRTVLAEADFQNAELTDCALLDCELDRANLRGVRADQLSLHGSTLDGLAGADSLRGAVIDGDQLLPLGIAALAAIGVAVGERPEPA